MSTAKTMARLMRLRELEEEQRRMELARANAELQGIESAITQTEQRIVDARRWFRQGLIEKDGVLRLAGNMERELAERIGGQLVVQRNAALDVTDARKQEFVAKRVERRQAEALHTNAAQAEQMDAARQSQVALDDWFHTRRVVRSSAVKTDERDS